MEHVHVSEEMKKRIGCFDETDHTLSSETDNGGSRSGSYTNPNLPRPGGPAQEGGAITLGYMGTMPMEKIFHPSTFLTLRRPSPIILKLNQTGVKIYQK